MGSEFYDVAWRFPFVIIAHNGYPCSPALFALEFWETYELEGAFVDATAPAFCEAERVWREVHECCKQAERMAALQPDASAAADVLRVHQRNLFPHVAELRAKMLGAGFEFPRLAGSDRKRYRELIKGGRHGEA